MELLKIIVPIYLLIPAEVCFVLSDGEEVKVTTKYGTIQGLIRHFPDIDKPIKGVKKFLGIPYAAPPTGDRRFQPPQEPFSWKPAVYNASYFRNICLQDPEYNNFFWPNFSLAQSEDCLYLNVYAPNQNLPPSKLYPVMVYIHGGGYDAGTPAVSPGDVIPLWGVVLVTIQYRLGVLGFATTRDSQAPGNSGMLDQIEALKWVRENIKDFGGDASSVTIFGESAGGSSVGLQLLSPRSKGLFHRAISISGVDLSPFATGSSIEVANQTRKVAKQLGCSSSDNREMIKCLRSVDAKRFPVNEVNVWRPIVDGHFLPDAPENLRDAGKFHSVPYMAGFTSREGSYFFPDVLAKVTPENFRYYTATIFYNIGNKYGQMMDGGLPKPLLDTIELLYTPWTDKSDKDKVRRGIADEVGGFTMTAPTHRDLLFHSQKAPAYMYEFGHRSGLNPSPLWKGTAHKDDTPYQFGFPFMNLTVLQKYDDIDRNVSDMVITLFTNFAKYGNPTPQPVRGVSWEEFNSSRKAYLRIHSVPEMAINFQPTRMAFWNRYYENMLKEEPKTCKSQSGESDMICLDLFCFVCGLCLFSISFGHI